MPVSVMAAFSPQFIPYNGPQTQHSRSQRSGKRTASSPKSHESRDLALSAGDLEERATGAGGSEPVRDQDCPEEYFDSQGAQGEQGEPHPDLEPMSHS